MTLITDVFPKLRTPKSVLKQISKGYLSDEPCESNMEGGPNTNEILTTPPLPYLLITVKTIELEKMSLNYMQNLKIFPNLFSLVFSSFLKCILKSEHFQTKDEPHS